MKPTPTTSEAAPAAASQPTLSYADRQQASERYEAPGVGAGVVQRWRDLRAMLNHQLEMFETGALTLRSNGVNISVDAIAELRRSILEFDALIAADRGQSTPVQRY